MGSGERAPGRKNTFRESFSWGRGGLQEVGLHRVEVGEGEGLHSRLVLEVKMLGTGWLVQAQWTSGVQVHMLGTKTGSLKGIIRCKCA